MNCLIVDPVPSDSDYIVDLLNRIPVIKMEGAFNDCKPAFNYISQHRVDLVLTSDHCLKSGFIKAASALITPPYFILISSNGNLAMEAYRSGAIDYLLKPLEFKKLVSAFNKVQLLLKAHTKTIKGSDHFFVQAGTKYIKVYFDELLYVEGDKGSCQLHTDSVTITCNVGLHIIHHNLPETGFVRIHKTIVVNKQRINKVELQHIIIGKRKLPVDEDHKHLVNGMMRSIQTISSSIKGVSIK